MRKPTVAFGMAGIISLTCSIAGATAAAAGLVLRPVSLTTADPCPPSAESTEVNHE